MSLTGNVVTPYPNAVTDASWKAAKTAAIRDKWNTELGAALRAAQVAYNKVKFDQLDLQRSELHSGRLRITTDVKLARTNALNHYKITVKPAIKALETAKSKATVAGLNVVITAPARAKARQISQNLGTMLAVLKSFNTTDYDRRIREMTEHFQDTFDTFDAKMDSALRAARQFIVVVRRDRSVAYYNEHIGPSARGLTQLVGQVERMKKSGLDLGKDASRATALFDDLTPRANEEVKLRPNASRQRLLAEVGEFEDQVDDVDAWWG